MNEEQISQTLLDQMVSSDRGQMIKAAIPYLPPKGQQIFSVYEKAVEFINTVSVFSKRSSGSDLCAMSMPAQNPVDIVNDIRSFCYGPSSVLDERDTDVIETGAAELRALLPPEGPVLVLGIGNRRVTADALGPRTAQKILVTMGPQHTLPVRGIRPVAALAPGVSGDTGLTLRQLAAAMVDAVRPAALICVDSLCSAEAARLGRTIQFSDTGLHPADARHARHLDAAALGVPVIAAGIPTLMDADEGADLVLTPRALDSVIAHGSALLAGILNRALQPRLSVAQLCWLTG